MPFSMIPISSNFGKAVNFIDRPNLVCLMSRHERTNELDDGRAKSDKNARAHGRFGLMECKRFCKETRGTR
jgi:hypothetical protein